MTCAANVIRIDLALPAIVLAMLLCSMLGCASTASQIGAAAAPAVVHSSLHEVNAPDDQMQLQRLVDSPTFHNAAEKFGEGVCVGIYNASIGLAGDGGSEFPMSGGTGATQPTSKPAGKLPVAAAVAGLGGGGMNRFVQSSVQEAFLAATDPQFKAGEEAMSEALGEGFVGGMIKVLNEKGPELGDTIRKQLGPIVQELIREQIAPALRDMLQQQLAPAALQVWREGAVETLKLTVRPDLQPDIQQNAQNISTGAGHGTREVLIESGWFTRSGHVVPKVKLIVWATAVAAAVILLAIFSLLIMLNLLAVHYWRRRNRDATSGK